MAERLTEHVGRADTITARLRTRLNEPLVARSLSPGGACTGERGIGPCEREFRLAEHGEGVSVMRALRRALDPDNILNPGKIVRV